MTEFFDLSLEYELPDLTLFDGALIHGSQIVNRRIREKIGAEVKKSGIPALSLDCPIEDFPLISIDNRKAEREITNHFIREHGARKLAFLTGLLDNGCPEGRQRLDGFLDACRENGIAEADREIIKCTWRTEDGVREAEHFFQDNRPLPDAFLCSNDEMALGVLSVLQKKVECLKKQYNDTSGMPFHLSLSIGSIFVKEPGGLPLDEYVKQADEAMYMAKKSGKHTYRFCGE